MPWNEYFGIAFMILFGLVLPAVIVIRWKKQAPKVEKKDLVKSLLAQGLSVREVAKRTGVSKSTVQRQNKKRLVN